MLPIDTQNPSERLSDILAGKDLGKPPKGKKIFVMILYDENMRVTHHEEVENVAEMRAAAISLWNMIPKNLDDDY
jgi:hypothetical protein